MKIDYWKTAYIGKLVGVESSPTVWLYGRHEKDWCLSGSAVFGCGKFLSWVTGGTYRDEQDREKIYPGPGEFTLMVYKSNTYPRMEDTLFSNPVLIHFHGVVWRGARHSTPDSICGGIVDFTCSSFEVEEEADTMTIVEGK